MENAKIFYNGGSQAVRLPKSCRFEEDEILVNRIGDAVVLFPKNSDWSNFFNGVEMLSEDFLADRENSVPLKEVNL